MPLPDGLKDELNEMIMCRITLDTFIDPVSIGCGHTFEREAIENPANQNCPLCKAQFRKLTPGLHMTNIVKLAQRVEKGEDIGIDDFRLMITSPVTQKIFYNPVALNCCAHTVERDMTADATCPCDENHQEWIPARDMKNLVDLAIKYFPELQSERYFRIDNIVRVLGEYNLSMTDENEATFTVKRLRELWEQNRIELNKLCEILKSSDYLNAISEEKNYEGSSVVTHLLFYPAGIQKIVDDTVLRRQITPEGFNAIWKEGDNKGYTAVLCLAGCPEGRKLLLEDQELRAKIRSEGLNSIPKNGNGTSTLFYLAKYCRQLLLEDEKRLCHLINIDTLMHPLSIGSNQRRSAYQCLQDSEDGKIILEVLEDKIAEWKKSHVSIVESGVGVFSPAEPESKKRSGENRVNDGAKRMRPNSERYPSVLTK